MVSHFVLKWFAEHGDILSVADIVEAHYPFVRGKLLFVAGQFGRAQMYLVQHLTDLESKPESEATKEGIAETRAMLGEIPAKLGEAR